MVNGDPRYRDVILDNLRRVDRERGFVTNEQVRRAAPLLGVTERHVRKLIRKKTKDRKGPWQPRAASKSEMAGLNCFPAG